MSVDRTQESLAKIEQVRSWLGGSGLAGVLLESNAGFSWVTAGGEGYVVVSEDGAAAAVLITPDRAAVLTPNIEAARLADEELPEGCFEVVEYPWHAPGSRGELISGIAGTGTVGSDSPSNEMPAAGPGLKELRRVLVQPEIDRCRELAQDAAFVVESACRAVSPKDSELEMAARVAALCYERNILPVVNLVAADDRISRYRHPLPTSMRAARTFLAALTARRAGLHASVTRTVCFGDPDPEQAGRHAACARIDARMIGASRPGTALSKVLAEAAAQYEAEGHPDEWRNHHQGGTTGYAGREVFATPDEEYQIKAGQALTWNPSVAGAKSEDTILVTDRGTEVLSTSGHWPMLEVDAGGGTLGRPGLLVR